MENFITNENETLTFEETKTQILNEINKREYNVPYWFILSFIENVCMNTKWSYLSVSKSISVSSYGLKHMIEKAYCITNKVTEGFKHGYCANNWVKLALYELGFDIINADNVDYETGKPLCKTYRYYDYLFNDILTNSINFYFKRNKYRTYRDIQKVWECINYKKIEK